jgi:hypothetical protein
MGTKIQISTFRHWKQLSNNISCGFADVLPREVQLNAAKQLIGCGVANNLIRSDYVLYGHRDVRATDCPGHALYREISTWPHKGIPWTQTCFVVSLIIMEFATRNDILINNWVGCVLSLKLAWHWYLDIHCTLHKENWEFRHTACLI